MLFDEIVNQIDLFGGVPVFRSKEMKCFSITYKTGGGSKAKGVYLPDCDIDAYYSYTQQNSPVEFEHMKKCIESVTICNSYTFAVFNALHELGHWMQYKNYIEAGHSDCEFFFRFELDRFLLLQERKAEWKCLNGCNDDFNKKYSSRYLELNTEKNANDYAVEHLSMYCEKSEELNW